MTELKYQISSEEAARLRSRIPLYLKTVIEKDWKESSTKPYDLPAWKFIAEMQAITRNWDCQFVWPQNDMVVASLRRVIL